MHKLYEHLACCDLALVQGGLSTCIHYLSSRTSGLFTSTISESGLCGSSLLELPQPIAEGQGTLLAEALGCPGSDASTIACLRGSVCLGYFDM